MTEKPAEVALGAPAALVLAGDAPPALVERLAAQLRALVGPVAIVDDLSELAAVSDPVLVADGSIAVHDAALANVLADPRPGAAILAGAPTRSAPAIEVRGGRVVSAGSPYHHVNRPNATYLGVVRVPAGDLAAAAEQIAALRHDAVAADEAAGVGGEVVGGDDFVGPDDEQRSFSPAPGAGGGLAALLLVALVRGGTPVRAVYLRRLGWTRGEAGVAALDAADEDRLQLDSSVKGYDSPFTTFLVSPYSRHLARWAARRGLTPNQVTVISLLIGLLAAAAFAAGAMIAGAVLVLAAFVTDCVDGQLARYTRTYSKLGAWLDAMFDRTKEYVVYAGLAIGAGDVWLLACAALALQTVRHMSDFAFAAARTPADTRLPLDEPGDRAAAAPRAALAAWRRADRSPALRWLKRALPFPIGERFAVIALTAAVFSPEVTFIALLTGTAIGFAYTYAGRLLRGASLHWLRPVLLCTAEFAAVIAGAAVIGEDAYPVAFAVLGVLALRRYDRNLRGPR